MDPSRRRVTIHDLMLYNGSKIVELSSHELALVRFLFATLKDYQMIALDSMRADLVATIDDRLGNQTNRTVLGRASRYAQKGVRVVCSCYRWVVRKVSGFRSTERYTDLEANAEEYEPHRLLTRPAKARLRPQNCATSFEVAGEGG